MITDFYMERAAKDADYTLAILRLNRLCFENLILRCTVSYTCQHDSLL